MNDHVLIPGDDSRLCADLSLESERLRLGPAGFKGFFAIAAKWNIADEQKRQLLGLEPESPLEELEAHPDPRLFTEHRLMRIGCVIGIYRGLHTCFGDKVADAWMTLPNQDVVFGGMSPIEYMIRGGLEAMFLVRRQTDAWCAGNV